MSRAIHDNLTPKARLFCGTVHSKYLPDSHCSISSEEHDTKNIDEDKLISLYQLSGEKTLTIKKIARMMGFTERAIFTKINKLINDGKLTSRKQIREREREIKKSKILELYHNNTHQEIATKVGVSVSTATNMIRELHQEGRIG